ncbi:MAG TPA: hypothetical protein VLY66_00060 [Candidatus Eisenbacteria bacterium]|nr:hypothetical protein [Candidatus Eisenbacteria bacterium]
MPSRIGSGVYENINQNVLHVNKDLADAYNANDIGKIKYYREALMEEEGMITEQPSP